MTPPYPRVVIVELKSQVFSDDEASFGSARELGGGGSSARSSLTFGDFASYGDTVSFKSGNSDGGR